MIGAVIGDVVGSLYAYKPIRTKDFELFDLRCHFTDDTIYLCAAATTLRRYIEEGREGSVLDNLREDLLDWTWRYSDVTYSRFFSNWMFEDDAQPYYSAGITAASRAVAAGELADSLEEALAFAEAIVSLTHGNAEGVKGAKCVAGCVYLAREGKSKAEIKAFVENGYYKFDYTLKQLLGGYQFTPTCPGAVMPAVQCFLDSKDYEDAIRNAIGMGGQDSLAAIAGGIAEAFYGVPEELEDAVLPYLDEDIQSAIYG